MDHNYDGSLDQYIQRNQVLDRPSTQVGIDNLSAETPQKHSAANQEIGNKFTGIVDSMIDEGR